MKVVIKLSDQDMEYLKRKNEIHKGRFIIILKHKMK